MDRTVGTTPPDALASLDALASHIPSGRTVSRPKPQPQEFELFLRTADSVTEMQGKAQLSPRGKKISYPLFLSRLTSPPGGHVHTQDGAPGLELCHPPPQFLPNHGHLGWKFCST